MAAVDRNRPRKAASSESTFSLMDFMREFPDDATCLDYLWRKHFATDGSHAECPRCGQVRKFHRVASRPSYSCDSCGHHLHPTADTIFHKSSTSLHLWFYAIFLMSQTRCGVTAKHLERELGVTYKTAWRMQKLIRERLMDQDRTELDGDVEADETWIGGKPRRYESRKNTPRGHRKTPVAGAVERGGRVIASPVRHQVDARDHVVAHVSLGARLITDEFGAYKTVGAKFARHDVVNHSQTYVEGDVYTNTIEGFWSMVKAGLKGVYRGVSPQHLQGYVNEYAWRWNHHRDTDPMFLTLLGRVHLT